MDKASATPNEIGGSKPPMGAQAPLQPLPAGDGDELASSPASSAASTLTVGGMTPPLSLWIDGLTVSTNADRLRVILYVWKPNA